jgi:thermostable 8-oxoguanine DNA glycosylase
MSLYRAALTVLKPHVPAMRSYASTHPMPAPLERRAWPTVTWVWRRFITSMITVQTRSTTDLWNALNADPDWHALRRGGPHRCPSRQSLSTFLKKHGVRFPQQKADRIRRSVDRDFAGLAQEVRRTFESVHDKRVSRGRRRLEEVRLSILLQEVLRGCGVAPKVSRLALLGAQEITQVIPIDSRWVNALEEAGHVVKQADLAHEESYREIEDVLCEVSYGLGVRPIDADGVGFGWALEEGV